MRKRNVIIKVATKRYIEEFYGDKYTRSFKGYVALINKKVVGVGGLSFENGYILFVTEMSDELRPFKRDIVKIIRVFNKMIKNVDYPIIAVANKKEPLAEKLLHRLGFTFIDRLTDNGSKIFRRCPQ